MPALAFLASVGLALVAMLFAANAMLPDNGPVIVVSARIGLPEPWHPDPDPTSPPAFAPIPAPEMASQSVIQPVSEAEGDAIKPAARTARAEAPPKKEKRVARQSTDRQQNHVQQNHVQQSSLVDRFSIRGQ